MIIFSHAELQDLVDYLRLGYDDGVDYPWVGDVTEEDEVDEQRRSVLRKLENLLHHMDALFEMAPLIQPTLFPAAELPPVMRSA